MGEKYSLDALYLIRLLLLLFSRYAVSDSVSPWSIACQAPLSTGILQARVLAGLPSPPPLSSKVCIVKAMVFPVVVYGCESWTIKKAECQRIDAFELWRWRRLLRVPWSARRSSQSILKEISPKYSLEGLTLKLKLQYFGHLMQRADSLEKTLMLGKTEGRRRRAQRRIRRLYSITDSMDMNLSKLLEMVKDKEVWHAAVRGVTESDVT